MMVSNHFAGAGKKVAPFALTTGDSAFNPAEPITVNGYAFAPVLVEDDDMGGEING